ncbi:MAG: 2-dehydropantoate 2-reductase N-terminal domain-containing protein [Nannocystaceae bacterium]
MSVRALVVGAGAVGQVFAHHLARGGAEVALLVKPAHAAALREGMTLYRLRRSGPVRERLQGLRILTAPSQAADTRWDQVYSAVSSAALRPATWFAELARATGDATIVFLQPNIDDREIATAHADPERLVDGMIGFLAYHSPLPGVSDDRDRAGGEPGMAFWFPPASPSRLCGDDARAPAVIEVLRAGGLPASRMAPSAFAAVTPFANAVLYASSPRSRPRVGRSPRWVATRCSSCSAALRPSRSRSSRTTCSCRSAWARAWSPTPSCCAPRCAWRRLPCRYRSSRTCARTSPRSARRCAWASPPTPGSAPPQACRPTRWRSCSGPSRPRPRPDQDRPRARARAPLAGPGPWC